MGKQPRSLEGSRSNGAVRWPHWVIIAAVVIAMARVVGDGFAPVDDPSTIWQNANFNPPTLEGIAWYWGHAAMGLYIPVTYTVWGVLAKATWVATPDEQGLHVDPRVFHAASLAVHVLST